MKSKFQKYINKKEELVIVMEYLLIDVPRFPWSLHWKFKLVQSISTGSNRNPTIHVSAATPNSNPKFEPP